MPAEMSRTQFPAQIFRRRASGDGDARIIVIHDDVDALRAVNRCIASDNDMIRRSNTDATPAPRATDTFTVFDLDSQSIRLVLLHRLNQRSQPGRSVGEVVVFSHPAYAPGGTESLQLATPAYYRDHEDLKPGIRDERDGTLTRDGSRWATSIMGRTVSARLSFVSSREPWVYCASHCRLGSDLERLRSEFEETYGYSAATRILDVDAFAAWLGVDLALGLDKRTDVSLRPDDEIAYACSSCTTSLWAGSRPIDTLVHVYYGPVHYEDLSGRIDKQAHWFDPNVGPLAWFTKRAALSDQSEYRFAASTLGAPVRPRHYIAVSPELRALTCVV